MTAALAQPPAIVQRPRIVIRPAPRREPPFDDELADPRSPVGPLDQRLPFATSPARHAWRPVPRRAAGVPDPQAWCRRLIIGMIETAAGRRPLHQLSALLSASVSRGLGADFEKAARAGRPHWLHRASVRSIRTAEPAEGIAEISATVDTGIRVRAIAMRLEVRHGRWRCTRLQLG
jgi:hypothetical protein